MKRIGIVIALLWLSFNICHAQRQGFIKETFCSDFFPEVSFIWHDYSLDLLTANDFRYVKEMGVRVPFKIDRVEDSKLSNPKFVILLWEDMNEIAGGQDIRKGQYSFTKSVLSAFFTNHSIGEKDRFYVIAFNRRKNNPTVLIPITNGFVSDKEAILSNIESYAHSKETYHEFSNRSDMFSAIRESLDTLKTITDDQVAKSIVVFTAGYAMTNSGNDSESQVLDYAQRLHVPVYIMEYFPRSGYATRPENFAHSTNGTFSAFDQNQILDAVSELERIESVMSESYFGKDYRISFTSNMKRGDDPVAIAFDVDGVEYQEQYLPPPFSFKLWLQEHKLLVLLLCMLLIVAITLAIVFSALSHHRKKVKLEELEEKQKQTEQQAQYAVTQANASIGQLKEQNNQQQLDDKARKLAVLMKSKNLYPRLHCDVGGNRFIYHVGKPVITIGRATDNDLVLDNKTVSGHHAKIVFTGDSFQLIDLNSSNHLIVNGIKKTVHNLSNGDLLAMGEVKISYYL